MNSGKKRVYIGKVRVTHQRLVGQTLATICTDPLISHQTTILEPDTVPPPLPTEAFGARGAVAVSCKEMLEKGLVPSVLVVVGNWCGNGLREKVNMERFASGGSSWVKVWFSFFTYLW